MPSFRPAPSPLLLASFLSGAAGLIFEIVWFHRSGLVFGSGVWSTSLVLSSFMGGLALGSGIVALAGSRVPNLLPAYAAVEIVIGVSGLAITYVMPALTYAVAGLVDPFGSSLWSAGVVRFAAAFVVLLVPATAMGATLPLLVAALSERRSSAFGPALGRVYGWNTLGAVAGVVGAEVWLVAWLGVPGSAWLAALLCTTAAALALVFPARTAGAAVRRRDGVAVGHAGASRHDPRGPASIRPAPLLACAVLAGAALLALEVIWFRFLTMFVLSTTLAVSLMLAVVLAAIGLGGLAASSLLNRFSQAASLIPAAAFAAGGAVAASYFGFDLLTGGTQIGTWTRTLWLGCVLTLPASLLSGALFTLLGDALRRALAVDTRTAGWLTFANTAGGMGGALLGAFVLLPALGVEAAFFALAAAYGGIGALALRGLGSWRAQVRSPALAAGAVALAAALIWFPFGRMDQVYVPRIVAPYAADGSRIVATREGPSETIFLMEQSWFDQPVYHRLVTNGFSMSGTAVTAMRYMKLFIYLPLMLHRGPIERVLVICYGVGITAGAALDLPDVETVDVVELSPDVVSMSDVMYRSDHPLRDPRARVHIGDGRQFLQTTREQFDLITGEPPPPRTPGAVNIYTREYFQLMADRLAAGGIATYWLPVGRPDPGTNVNSIVRAFCDVFADCSLWNATPFDLVLVGSRGQAEPIPEDELVRPWTMPALRARLTEIGVELPQQVGATFLGDAAYLRRLAGDAPPLVDDHPHRLHPVPGRPSLSDPGYGVDPAVTAHYQEVIDPVRARRAFESSELIERLWPRRLIDATLPYFEHQAALNAVLWDGGRPLEQIETLHRLLSTTPLRTLPLWLLGSDAVRERIARRGRDGTGADDYVRAMSALASRDYPGAAAALAEAQRAGVALETVRPLRAYALAMAGDVAAARGVGRDVQPGSDAERHFWSWLGARFGVGPSGGS